MMITLSTAVLYDGGDNDSTWRDTFGYLEQSTLVGLSAAAIDANGSFDLSSNHIVYLDQSLAKTKNSDAVTAAVEAYTSGGGVVVMDNALYPLFDPAFIGASDYGADTVGLGINQHTWYTSTFNQAQSLLSACDAGFLWNPGFAPAGGTPRAPQTAAKS